MKIKSTCALALTFGMLAATNAAVIIDATNITYTGTFPEGAVLGPATTITNDSGLSEDLTPANIGTVTHDSFNAGNAWVSTDPGGSGSDFFANNGGLTVSFDIIFTDTYNVDTLSTWGYGWNADVGNNASAITIDYGVGNFASTTGSLALPVPTWQESDTINLGGIVADRVRITITDNHFGASGGGDRVGISELAFVGDVVAVPEPSSAALLGLGGLSLILRRRK
ncbi:PEP-CTERM sorting domain-containing protein [Verrucomicrobiaceae bacterium N1E253]|uniref:PEP-CTERM sorting domain-containing protein n=1 Tax=Oceaniferula marina TaxID=2748318 RepID=A0A851GAT4_9BACT|nr:PEP-CTERM sorting domain-containing protein [Oceaniferula marina]NWK54516.1 PEP-CTERM sorting domain-containing protein [Oceaniferula marina]